MGPVLERLIMFVVTKVLTPELIKGSEAELIAFLRSWAGKSSDSALLYGLIDLLAVALGVT